MSCVNLMLLVSYLECTSLAKGFFKIWNDLRPIISSYDWWEEFMMVDQLGPSGYSVRSRVLCGNHKWLAGFLRHSGHMLLKWHSLSLSDPTPTFPATRSPPPSKFFLGVGGANKMSHRNNAKRLEAKIENNFVTCQREEEDTVLYGKSMGLTHTLNAVKTVWFQLDF